MCKNQLLSILVRAQEIRGVSRRVASSRPGEGAAGLFCAVFVSFFRESFEVLPSSCRGTTRYDATRHDTTRHDTGWRDGFGCLFTHVGHWNTALVLGSCESYLSWMFLLFVGRSGFGADMVLMVLLVWLLVLFLCGRWGNLGSAKADAQRAMDIDPHHIKAYFRRAAAHKQVWTIICIISYHGLEFLRKRLV